MKEKGRGADRQTDRCIQLGLQRVRHIFVYENKGTDRYGDKKLDTDRLTRTASQISRLTKNLKKDGESCQRALKEETEIANPTRLQKAASSSSSSAFDQTPKAPAVDGNS